MYFQSLNRQEGNLKLCLLIKSEYHIVPNPSSTLVQKLKSAKFVWNAILNFLRHHQNLVLDFFSYFWSVCVRNFSKYLSFKKVKQFELKRNTLIRSFFRKRSTFLASILHKWVFASTVVLAKRPRKKSLTFTHANGTMSQLMKKESVNGIMCPRCEVYQFP